MNFLLKAEAAERVGYHPVHLMRLVKQGLFPKPFKLGPRRTVFVEEEVEAWIAERIASRDAETTEEGPQT